MGTKPGCRIEERGGFRNGVGNVKSKLGGAHSRRSMWGDCVGVGVSRGTTPSWKYVGKANASVGSP